MQRLFANNSIRRTNYGCIRMIVGNRYTAFGAKHFNPLIIAIYRLTAVINDTESTIRNRSVTIAVSTSPCSAKTGLMSTLPCAYTSSTSLPATIASHVEVMDHHIHENAARHLDVISMWWIRITGSDFHDMRIANCPSLNNLANPLEVMVKSRLKPICSFTPALLTACNRRFGLGDIHADWLFAENMFTRLCSQLNERDMRIRG